MSNSQKFRDFVPVLAGQSKFERNEARKAENLQFRIAKIQKAFANAASLTPLQFGQISTEIDTNIHKIKKERDLTQLIALVDMDSFFASVEMRDNPHFRNIPMAVGDQSMLCTANYKAREYGVRSGMPGYMATKLCPQLLIVAPRFSAYVEASKGVKNILSHYDQNVESSWLDEAYINLTAYCKNHSKLVDEVAEEIRNKIQELTGLTASIGIACNRLLAKICSEVNKPNGQFRLNNDIDDINDFINDLPISKIPGIGKVTQKLLESVGILKCSDIYEKRLPLSLAFQPLSYEYFIRCSLGFESTKAHSTQKEKRKSTGVERTFSQREGLEEMTLILESLCAQLCLNLQCEKLKCRTISVKIKFADFRVITRAQTLSKYIDQQNDIFDAVKALINSELGNIEQTPIRLLGVRASNLNDNLGKKELSSFFTSSKVIEKHTAKTLNALDQLCPVCSIVFPKYYMLREINDHLDSCLQISKNPINNNPPIEQQLPVVKPNLTKQLSSKRLLDFL